MLQTARLTLRAPADADAELLRVYHLRNAERFDPWEPRRGTDVEEHERWIAMRRDDNDAGRGRSFLAFTPEAPEALVAIVNLDAISHAPQHSAMLSYSVDGVYEGRGYVREACEAVIAYAFGELDLRSLSATYDPANDRSGGLLTRLGFRELARSAPTPGFERFMRAQVLAGLDRPA